MLISAAKKEVEKLGALLNALPGGARLPQPASGVRAAALHTACVIHRRPRSAWGLVKAERHLDLAARRVGVVW